MSDALAYFIAPGGQTVAVDASQAPLLTGEGGYIPASPKQIADYQIQRQYGSGLEGAKAFAEHAASAATLGGSDVLERALGISTPEAMAGREKANPALSMLGTGAGVLGGLAIPASPLGLAARGAKGVAGAIREGIPAAESIAGKVAARAAAAGAGSWVEGTALGLGQVVHEGALGDPNLTAQSALATVGLTGAMGGALGVAGSLIGSAAEGGLKALPGWLQDIGAREDFQAIGGDKGLARKYREKYPGESFNKMVSEWRDRGIIQGPVTSPQTALGRAQDLNKLAGQRIGDMLRAADGVVLPSMPGGVMDEALGVASKLSENPFEATTAKNLQDVLAQYETKFAQAGGATLTDLHDMEMQFGQQVYGMKGQRNPALNPYIDSLNRVRGRISAAVDAGVDASGAVEKGAWADANRTFQVSRVAQRVAEHGVTGATGNNLLSLSGMIGGLAGASIGGAAGGIASAVGTQALKKYGSGFLGYAARALREGLEGGTETLAGATAEGVAAARMAGQEIPVGITAAPDKVAVLSLLERVNQATTNKINTAMSAIVNGGPRAAQIGRNEAAAGIAKIFGAPIEEQRTTFLKRTQDVRALALDPQQLQDRLTQQTNDWHEHAPQTAQALQITTARAVAFLSSKLPQTGQTGPLAGPSAASRAEISKFTRYYEAIQKPTSLLKEAAAGTLTAESIEAVKTVYPELFARMQRAAMEKLAGAKAVPYRSKLMLSLLLGQPMDGTTTPFALMANRAVFAKPIMPPPRAPSRASPLTLGSRMLTPSQAAAQREKP